MPFLSVGVYSIRYGYETPANLRVFKCYCVLNHPPNGSITHKLPTCGSLMWLTAVPLKIFEKTV